MQLIGERIQYYRKKKGLSQEELGTRLHLSRQTVSLWEKGQTLPTIDNLLRLREIFDTSLDELVEERSDEALERYEMTLSSNELDRVKRRRVARLCRSTLPSFFVWGLMTAVLLLLEASTLFIGFVLGALFVDLSLGLSRLFADVRGVRRALDGLFGNTLIYTVAYDELRIEVLSDGKVLKSVACPFSTLETGETVDTLTSFKVGGDEYFLSRDLISENSILLEYI
ncbi:MAG: helix-turn-helix transcriptional regulator [Clostridia bacterium]|nr:helix-turn-helix transcriptional regulator [Clostridia bacterium]